MKIGIPKEIKNNENRVGMTPAGVAEFIRHGHEVMVQHTAGENSGFADEAYEKVGAIILPDIQSVYREAEMLNPDRPARGAGLPDACRPFPDPQ